MDANGLMSGDRGYDPSTEQGYQQEPSSSNSSLMFGKVGKPEPTDAELWLDDHPAQEMAPIDFSSAPSWWNKGQGGQRESVGGFRPRQTNIPTDRDGLSGRLLAAIGEGRQDEYNKKWVGDNTTELGDADFSGSPGWWNKGDSAGKIGSGAGGGNPMANQPGFGKVGAGNSPTDSVMPDYGNIVDQQPSSPGRMIDYIGDVGGQTGVVATSPLAAGLRGVAAANTGGQSNG